jgi:SAM-dependent methyltransferase
MDSSSAQSAAGQPAGAAVRVRPSPFDEMAASYDSGFTYTACAAALRRLVWEHLSTVFAGRARILELGCGTGEDAIRLAQQGHDVVATDASAAMIEQARRKAEAAGCAGRIDFRELPMEALQDLPHGLRFDGVFSNFGAVNCVADLQRLAGMLAARLEPGAPLLFVAMGRLVPWEWLWYGLRAEPRKAFRRLRRGGIEWRGCRIHYPSPRQLADQLRGGFTARHAHPLGLLLPPSYACGWIHRHPRLLDLLLRFERRAHRWPRLAGLADHYVFEAARNLA